MTCPQQYKQGSDDVLVVMGHAGATEAGGFEKGGRPMWLERIAMEDCK
jgi:hypothetical protein